MSPSPCLSFSLVVPPLSRLTFTLVSWHLHYRDAEDRQKDHHAPSSVASNSINEHREWMCPLPPSSPFTLFYCPPQPCFSLNILMMNTFDAALYIWPPFVCLLFMDSTPWKPKQKKKNPKPKKKARFFFVSFPSFFPLHLNPSPS